MISEQESIRLQLPGSDNFIESQLAYKGSLNRDGFVITLLDEAYKAFMLTSLIGEYESLLKEQEINTQQIIDQYPSMPALTIVPPPLRMLRYDDINLENLLVSTGFEISIRARLLHADYLVQKIDNEVFQKLHELQLSEPIHKDVFLAEAKSGYYYDEKLRRNYLLGLREETVSYSKLLNKSDYKNVINLSDDVIEVADEYRKLRNQIHFPGDSMNSDILNKYKGDSLIKFIVEYINSEIVNLANSLIKKNGSNRAFLKRITYFDTD